MSNKRLNIFSILFYLYSAFKNIFVFVIALIVAKPILGIVITLILVVIVLVRYLTYRYSVLDDQILIKYGLFLKKELHIPYDKIQVIQHNQWFFLKPFNLEQVILDTASHSDSKSKVDLRVISIDAGQFIETKHAKSAGKKIPKEKDSNYSDNCFYRATTHDMKLFAATNFSFISAISLITVLIFQLFLNDKKSFESINHASFYFVISFLVGFMILIYIVGFIKTQLKYYKFTVHSEDTYFRISSGLFKRKVDKIPIDKIQNIVFIQNIIRKMLNITTINVDLITENDDENINNGLLIPFIKSQLVYEKIGQSFSYVCSKPFLSFTSYKNAFWLFTRNVLWIPLTLLIMLFFIRDYIFVNVLGLAILILIIFSVLTIINAFIKSKNVEISLLPLNKQGIVKIKDVHLFNYYTNFVQWDKIQSMSLKQTYFMKKYHNLAHLEINIRVGEHAKKIECRYLKYDDAKKIIDWYKLS
ncbi:PH domain-containing protein [Apilactobacillus ozensis]|uniref:PH domain-containing protein n=1 Tax=Apilactobacillus ozensis TaxID=866801 RepID=UPI00200A2705|nr:PH domain-containing protein [Apilactobacillus ozensis]MCK8606832.1 PH domain-containing protein [Apilactobacillus ozensis]